MYRQSKKRVKQQYLHHISIQYGERRPTNCWDRLVSFERPSKFQRVSRLGFVTAPASLNGGQPNFARCLTVSWDGTLHFWVLLPPNGILPGAKCTLRPSLALSYIGSVTTRHSISGRQPNFAAWWYLHVTGRPSRLTLGDRTVSLLVYYRTAHFRKLSLLLTRLLWRCLKYYGILYWLHSLPILLVSFAYVLHGT